MGPRLFHQAYCMTFDSFSCMHHILLPYIDISIKYGGSSSNLLVFEAGDLFHRLENGLMKKDHDKPRFVLFGNNAYLNTSYIATPFPTVSSNQEQRSKDNYNFYHSQLCIRV
jgi:hypothetical protein